MHSLKRYRAKIKSYQCLKCSAKTVAFLFWASIYMFVMKMTIFKSNTYTKVKDWSLETDNYTKWLLQGPVLGEDNSEGEINDIEWSEPDNKTVIEIENRVKRVKEVCKRRLNNTETINSKEFFVDHAHGLVWCNIFKAASSSWLYKFNILGGYSKNFLSRTRHTPLTLARKKFPRPSEEVLHEAVNTPGVISLLVVREPFVRLLSAYRDKLENVSPPYYRKLAKNIVGEYRNKASKDFGNIKNIGPTFYEFVSYLIDKSKSKKQMLTIDEHWAPYYHFCSPCAINFNVIAKVETLSRDTAYVINQLGLNHVLGRRVKNRRTRLRTVMNKSKDGKNTTALLKSYYSQLDDSILDDLLRIYGLDFEMFGYDSNIYRQYVKKTNDRLQ